MMMQIDSGGECASQSQAGHFPEEPEPDPMQIYSQRCGCASGAEPFPEEPCHVRSLMPLSMQLSYVAEPMEEQLQRMAPSGRRVEVPTSSSGVSYNGAPLVLLGTLDQGQADRPKPHRARRRFQLHGDILEGPPTWSGLEDFEMAIAEEDPYPNLDCGEGARYENKGLRRPKHFQCDCCGQDKTGVHSWFKIPLTKACSSRSEDVFFCVDCQAKIVSQITCGTGVRCLVI